MSLVMAALSTGARTKALLTIVGCDSYVVNRISLKDFTFQDESIYFGISEFTLETSYPKKPMKPPSKQHNVLGAGFV